MTEPLTPIYTADLFPALHVELIGLLRGLSDADWTRPTVARTWRGPETVGDLLDLALCRSGGVGDFVGPLPAIVLRKFSGGRDGHRSSFLNPAATSFDDVVD